MPARLRRESSLRSSLDLLDKIELAKLGVVVAYFSCAIPLLVHLLRHKSLGLPLLLPLLISLASDAYGYYLESSGSWNLITGFLYYPPAVVAYFWAFSLQIKTKILFRGAAALTFIGVAAIILYAIFGHGLRWTNINESLMPVAFGIPLVLANALLLELDSTISMSSKDNQSVIWLNRTWIIYFIFIYFDIVSRPFTQLLESPVLNANIKLTNYYTHTTAYVLLVVISSVVAWKYNLTKIWGEIVKS